MLRTATKDSWKPQGRQRRHQGCLRIATKHSRELREESPAPDLAVIFAKEIWRLHGLPSDIVSDRDTRFTSHSGKNRRITSVSSYRRPPLSIPKPTANKTIGRNYFRSPSTPTTPPFPRQPRRHRSRELRLPTRDAVDPTSSVGGELHQPRERVASSTLETLAASRIPEIAIEDSWQSRIGEKRRGLLESAARLRTSRSAGCGRLGLLRERCSAGF
jgi:hypothetical protein